MKTILFKNLIDSKTKELVTLEVPDTFDEYSDSLAQARLRGKLMGKRFKKVFRNKPVRSTG